MKNNSNMSNLESILRIVIGAGILAIGLIFNKYWSLIGILPFFTGLFGYCPLYDYFKFGSDVEGGDDSTTKEKKVKQTKKEVVVKSEVVEQKVEPKKEIAVKKTVAKKVSKKTTKKSTKKVVKKSSK